MKIEEYLDTEKLKSRQQLSKETGLTERAVRHQISQLKCEKVVIYSSQTKGYRLAKPLQELATKEELEKEIDHVQHCLNDIEARKKVFNMQERKYIAYLKKAEQKKFFIENDNHIPRLD